MWTDLQHIERLVYSDGHGDLREVLADVLVEQVPERGPAGRGARARQARAPAPARARRAQRHLLC